MKTSLVTLGTTLKRFILFSKQNQKEEKNGRLICKIMLNYKSRNVTKLITKWKDLSMCLTCRADHPHPDGAACVSQQTSSPSTIKKRRQQVYLVSLDLTFKIKSLIKFILIVHVRYMKILNWL